MTDTTAASPVTLLDVADETGLWFCGSRGQDEVDRMVVRLALVAGLVLDEPDRLAYEAYTSGVGAVSWANWFGTDTLGEWFGETLVGMAVDYLNSRTPDHVQFWFDGGDFRLDTVGTPDGEPEPSSALDPWITPDAHEPPF